MMVRPDRGVLKSVTAAPLRPVVLALAVSVLIVLVVLASRSASVQSDSAELNPGPVIAIIHTVEIVGIAIEILAIVLWVLASRLAKRHEEGEEEKYHELPRVHWLIKVILLAFPLSLLGLLIYALYRFRFADPSQFPDLSRIFAPTPGNTGPTDRDIVAVFGLAWWEYGISIALAGLVIAAVVWALRREDALSRTPPDLPFRARVLSYAVDAGLHDARAERDPRRAVIAAYATMERILAARGLPRRETEAPLEYMSRLFAELGVGSQSIHTLTDLFEVARFSHHRVGPAMKERAIAALEALRQELRPTP
jgi:Domain of unknown function (DUF4129)